MKYLVNWFPLNSHVLCEFRPKGLGIATSVAVVSVNLLRPAVNVSMSAQLAAALL